MEKAPQNKKALAFKSTPSIFDEENDDQEDNEDLFFLVENVRMMYSKSKFNNRLRWQEKEEKKIICYNCRKPKHVADCSETKDKPTISKNPYKKMALKATWDSENKFEEETDTVNVCFMANENTPKVTSESSLDECELSMDELGETFEELFNNYDFLKKKYLKMKKKNELLQNQLVIIFKGKELLSSTL